MSADWREFKPVTADLVDLFDSQMKIQDKKPTPLSEELAGHAKLFSNMRTGRAPNVESVKAICDALGLEFYVGLPRLTTESSSSPPALGPADARNVRIQRSERGRIGVEVEIGPLGTARYLLTPAEAKDMAHRLSYWAMRIEGTEEEEQIAASG